ncbi:hypothetical protein [Lysobacter sp. ESA13C]|uniref:hypothetical protein n=1 Tax=Lysobacter sp. ESA13C TaxID=2862676 RepID=UPI001CBE7D6A|nr:hypothetical protein [Lysobacter sp. ESA13C]
MCEPTTIALAVTAVVGAYSAYTAYEGGKNQAKIADYQAAQTEADAKAEAGAAQVESDRIRKRGRQAAAEANVAIAASGQQLGSAGSLAINREIYRGAEEDAYFALIGGRDRATRLNAQGQLTREGGKMAKSAGKSSAFAQLLQTGASTYSGWKRAGSPTPQTRFGPGTI